MTKESNNKTKKTSSRKKGKDSSSDLMDTLKKFVRTRGPEYLKDPNISSVGIARKKKDGKPTKELALRFTVKEKAQPEELESLGTKAIPKSVVIEGVEVPTDVIQRDYEVEYKLVSEAQPSDRKVRLNPITPGISVGHTKISAGTIGCVVYDRLNGTPYILSNWHVLNGALGKVDDDIVQPGTHDDNRTNMNRLGKLVRSHLGQAGDCAVATIEGRGINPAIFDLGVVVDELGEPEDGDKVIKSGRTTGVTHGIVSATNLLTKMDYDDFGEAQIGSFEIEVDQANPPDNGEISMGGDSGAAWVFKSNNGQPTKVLAGIHFAGESSSNPREYALACYPKSVFEKLEISLSPPAEVELVQEIGFAQNFLSVHVGLPKLSVKNKNNAFNESGSEVINYTHFSLALNKVRKFAFWVGWNIDGENFRRLSRRGIPFILDPRIPAEFQAGEELYAGNRLDRGHIARRADLIWGGPAEAKKANKDSFFFTNITPQMDDFNQSQRNGLWGRLEDAVFEDTDVENLRVSVFAGPVFREDDREFREVKIPREFWKIILFVEGQKLKAKAFLLTQNLDQLEAFELDTFKVFQVALTEIETRCGLTFPAALKTADSVGKRLNLQPEALSERKPLAKLEDIDWS